MRSILKALLLVGLYAYNVVAFASFAPTSQTTYGGFTSGYDYCLSVPLPSGTSQFLNWQIYGSPPMAVCNAMKNGGGSQEYGATPVVPAGSCGPFGTNTNGSCDCNSGYSENATHTGCEPRAGSPNGPSAPTRPDGPLGPAPYFGVGALAGSMLGLIGLASGVGTFPTLLIGSGAMASGVIAAPGWFGAFSSPITSQSAMDQGGTPISVRLDPSVVGAGTMDGGSPGVAVNSNGQFVPAGGGAFAGNGATGGWSQNTGGATGEWTYTPPAISPTQPLPPVLAISNGGYTIAASSTTAPDGSNTGSIVAQRYSDGSMTVTEAHTVPVVTDSGTYTTANVQVTTTYGAGGTRISGSTVGTVGATLGNGTPAAGTTSSGAPNVGGNGFAITGPGSGYSGSKTGSGSGNGAPCGTPSLGPCLVSGEVTVKNPMKIDEGGMPADWSPDKFKSLADAYKAQGESQLGRIGGADDKGFFSGWSNFFAAPALVSCTPFVLPRDMGTLDACPVVDGVRYIMSLLWSLGGLLLCIGMVRKVVV